MQMFSKKTAGKCWRFCLKKLCFTSDLDDLDFRGFRVAGFLLDLLEEGVCVFVHVFYLELKKPILWANWEK